MEVIIIEENVIVKFRIDVRTHTLFKKLVKKQKTNQQKVLGDLVREYLIKNIELILKSE